MLTQTLIVARFHAGRSAYSSLKLCSTITHAIERHLSISAYLNSNESMKTKLSPESKTKINVTNVDVKPITSNPTLQARLKPFIDQNPERLEWKPVYRFNHILLARAAQKAKIGQTILTCFVVLPMCVTSYLTGHSELETVTNALAISTLAMMMLNVVGSLSSRIVGAVYLPKDFKQKDEVILSTLSFWGNRRDTVMPRNSFVHISDMDVDADTDVFITLQYIDKTQRQEPRYLSLRFGTIEDVEGFQSVFGELVQLRPKKSRPSRR